MKTFAAIGFGAVIVFLPLAAMAQSKGSALPEQVAQADTAHPGGSHSRQMRHRANTHKERARAGAEHMRMMRHAPAAPKS